MVKLQGSHIAFLVVGLVVGYLLSMLLGQMQGRAPEGPKAAMADGAAVLEVETEVEAVAETPMATTESPSLDSGEVARAADASAQESPAGPERPVAKAIAQEKKRPEPKVKASEPVRPVKGEVQRPPAPPRPPQPVVEEESAPVEPSNARIWIETTDYDAGLLPTTQTTIRRLKVANKGTEPLLIKSVKASCGCTSARIEKNELAPNAETELVVTIDPNRIHGFESKKSVTIYSNDSENPRLKLDVSCRFEREFILEPENIDFGEVAKGAMAEASMVLRQVRDEPVTLLEVAPWGEVEGFTLSFDLLPESEWRNAGHREYRIRAKLLPEVSPGPFMGRFRIKTDVSRVPYLSSYAKGMVKAFYDVKPTNLVLHNQRRDGDSMSAMVRVSADRPFTLVDLKTSHEAIDASLRPGPGANTTLIDVSLDPEKAQSGTWNEKLMFGVKTGDTVYREQVNIRVLMRGVLPTPGKVVPQAAPGPAGEQ